MPANHCIPHTPAAKAKIAQSLRGKGKWANSLPCAEIANRLINTPATTRTIAKEYGCAPSTIKLILCRYTTLELRLKLKFKKQGASLKGRHNPKFRQWFIEHHQEIQAKAVRALHKHPNKWELKASQLIEKACPAQYKFVGDGTFMIGNYNPDFVNVNGQKKLIEVFGEYWHKGKGLRKWHQTELGRIMLYNAFGFNCLILWANDLEKKSEEELVTLVRKFTTNKRAVAHKFQTG